MKHLLAGTALLALCVGPVEAAQITFGPSNQNITFTGNGLGSVSVASGTLTGLALDPTNAAVGSFTLSPLSFTAGPEAAGLFPAGPNSATFTYSNPDGDTITETWTISRLQDNTPQPKFFGTGVTTSISGDPAFIAAFGPVGTTDSFDWIQMPLTCTVPANCVTLDALALTTTSAQSVISSGEKFGTVVPEPATLGILGGALLLIATLRRRTK